MLYKDLIIEPTIGSLSDYFNIKQYRHTLTNKNTRNEKINIALQNTFNKIELKDHNSGRANAMKESMSIGGIYVHNIKEFNDSLNRLIQITSPESNYMTKKTIKVICGYNFESIFLSKLNDKFFFFNNIFKKNGKLIGIRSEDIAFKYEINTNIKKILNKHRKRSVTFENEQYLYVKHKIYYDILMDMDTFKPGARDINFSSLDSNRKTQFEAFQIIIGNIEVEYTMNITKNTIEINPIFTWKNNYNNILIDIYNAFINIGKYIKDDQESKSKYYNLFATVIYTLFDDSNNITIHQHSNYFIDTINKIKDEQSFNNIYHLLTFDMLYNRDKEINNILIKMPIIKNNKNKVKSDVLIISYNENAQKFIANDCYPILHKIILERPSFIVVSTQESYSRSFKNAIFETQQYPHVLGENLKILNYSLLDKEDASAFGIKDKNVRTRIYYNNYTVVYNKVLNKVKNKVKNKVYLSNTIKNQSNTNTNKFIIKKYSYKISSKSGLSTFLRGTIYKGSIFFRLEFTKNDVDYKFIFVNSHLSYKNDLSNGQKQFIDLIEEFNLITYWKKGYNIFFLGDLNFRVYSIKNNPEYSLRKKIKNAPKINQSPVYKENSWNNYKSPIQNTNELYIQNTNELYQYLNKLKKNNATDFYKQLQESITELGIHLKGKYYNSFSKNKNKEANKLLANKSIKDKTRIFPRIPYQTDKILYAIANNNNPNIKISASNFEVWFFPNKSDHKMITLSFELIVHQKKTAYNSLLDSNLNNKETISKRIPKIFSQNNPQEYEIISGNNNNGSIKSSFSSISSSSTVNSNANTLVA